MNHPNLSVNPVQIGRATLYLGDCLDVLPTLGAVDAVVTDPPYPKLEYGWEVIPPSAFSDVADFQLWFWMNMEPFDAVPTARHIWVKPNVFLGGATQYETIYQIGGGVCCRAFREAAILPNYTQYAAECVDHPTQKPLRLMHKLLALAPGSLVFDPFMGSGTTGVAAVEIGRSFIGVEKDERFFSIACDRIEKAQLQGDFFVEAA